MNTNKLKSQNFLESAAVIVIAAVFVVGGGTAVYRFSKLAISKMPNLKINAEVSSAVQNKQEADKALEKRKQELLKAEVYPAPFLGSEDAKIEVEAFFDFGCPYSKIFFTNNIMKQVKNKILNSGKFKLVFRNYPSVSDKSYDMAMSAACAGEQGRFWQMQEQLFINADEIKDNNLGFSGYANQIGLNMNLFEYCMTNKKYNDAILQDIARAEKMGVKRVPMFAIDGKIVKEGLPSEGEVDEWIKK